MSIIVFAVQQGKLISAHAKNCDVPNLCVRNTELLKILYCVPSVAESGTYVCIHMHMGYTHEVGVIYNTVLKMNHSCRH